MNEIQTIAAVAITVMPITYYVLSAQTIVTYIKHTLLTLTK